ncbi:hypothetical protein T12_11468 [Trichinella patagoniensis]|uniref:Uncharacterized protein n=1 Tax=Trichinella patagoniensis TaxID=990121 RepID=A0A0V0ZXF2_9BILA|nr:hypothetical protein T12_11468 [Trichinella patagoniensis]
MAGCFSVTGSLPPTRSVPASSRKGLRERRGLLAATSLFALNSSISFRKPCPWAIRTQICSAASNSWAVRGPPRRSPAADVQFFANRRQSAVIRNSFSMSPYLLGWRTSSWACVTTETNRAAWDARASSSGGKELGSEGPLFRGHPSAGPESHLGPCHQRLFLASPFKDDPRLSKSAGLSFPGQCLQHVGSTNRWISSTRLRTNGFHRLDADRTHASVTSLSLQQNRERTPSCEASWANRISLAAVRAPISSNLGRLRRFTGETRVFAATKLTRVDPNAVSTRR